MAEENNKYGERIAVLEARMSSLEDDHAEMRKEINEKLDKIIETHSRNKGWLGGLLFAFTSLGAAFSFLFANLPHIKRALSGD